MSALGQKQTFGPQNCMSALAPKADSSLGCPLWAITGLMQRCILCWTDALPLHFGRIAVVDRKLNIVNGRRYSTFQHVKCVGG
jgi:hypothetical protein